MSLSMLYIRTYAGMTVKTGPQGHVHSSSYDEENPTGPLRTSAQCYQHAKDAIVSGSPVTHVCLYECMIIV